MRRLAEVIGVLASLAASVLLYSNASAAEPHPSILFIGNSFTYAHGSAVRFYRSATVTDLNGGGVGGVPALFKSFAQQAGIDYDVYLETIGGAGLDRHLARKMGVIGSRPWDKVVMHGYSTLDADKPRDPAQLIATAKRMADALRARNPNVELYLMATFPRADQTYPADTAWHGETIDAMARDVRKAYDRAAESASVKMVIPVGEAWIRAMQSGIADPNPYDGIEAGKLNLWATDNYHASAQGYYLEALVIFGSVTGRDPRSLGDNECSAFELGFERPEVHALQQVAFEQLESTSIVTANPRVAPQTKDPVRCAAAGSVVLPVNAADEAPVLFRVTVKSDGKVVDSPSFLAKVGEPATVKLSSGISIEGLAKPMEADGRAWTQVRITFFETPDSKMVQEMSLHHKYGLRTGSFEYTDPLNRRYVIQIGNAGR